MEIMKTAFKTLKNKDCDFIWCNARLAVPFYHVVGMKEIGNLFDHIRYWSTLLYV